MIDNMEQGQDNEEYSEHPVSTTGFKGGGNRYVKDMQFHESGIDEGGNGCQDQPDPKNEEKPMFDNDAFAILLDYMSLIRTVIGHLLPSGIVIVSEVLMTGTAAIALGRDIDRMAAMTIHTVLILDAACTKAGVDPLMTRAAEIIRQVSGTVIRIVQSMRLDVIVVTNVTISTVLVFNG